LNPGQVGGLPGKDAMTPIFLEELQWETTRASRPYSAWILMHPAVTAESSRALPVWQHEVSRLISSKGKILSEDKTRVVGGRILPLQTPPNLWYRSGKRKQPRRLGSYLQSPFRCPRCHSIWHLHQPRHVPPATNFHDRFC
jgi:hypothetical protein